MRVGEVARVEPQQGLAGYLVSYINTRKKIETPNMSLSYHTAKKYFRRSNDTGVCSGFTYFVNFLQFCKMNAG